MSKKTILVKAPTRADLTGGTLDIWPLYLRFENTKTINFALSIFSEVTLSVNESTKWGVTLKNGEKNLEVYHLKELLQSKMDPTLKFPAFLTYQFLKYFEIHSKNHFEIEIKTYLPQGSSLGGSSSLCVALVTGLARLTGQFEIQGWQWKLLDWVKDVEASFLGYPTGYQDYLASLWGGLKAYEFLPGAIKLHALSQHEKTLSERVLLLYSGEMHNSGSSNWEVYKRIIEGEKKYTGSLSELCDISEKAFLELCKGEPSWKEFGKLLSQDWNIRKEGFNFSTPTLDEIVNWVSKQDILGCRVCGAAKGGTLLIFVEPEKKKRVIEKIEEKSFKCLPFSLSPTGVLVTSL